MDRSSKLVAHPLFLCGFRPFFLFTAGYGVLALAAWLTMLTGWLPMPGLPGGVVAWHAHEMIFGFAMASVAGFLLTAIPEFTDTPGFSSRILLGLALLWVGGRLAFLLAGLVTIWPAALLNIALAVWLLRLFAPPVWKDPGRPQVAFVHALLALISTEIGFFVALLREAQALPWMYAANGVLMILIVATISRISMRVVNGGDDLEEGDAGYRARPPRRNLATFAIALCTLVELLRPADSVLGWLALAAAAAILNLLNDWHVGRPLLRRWPLMLYAVYVLMAIGYAGMGIGLLTGVCTPSAGRHVLMAGAMSLAILTVMCIAGRNHAGYRLDRRFWVVVAAIALGVAAVLRALAAVAGVGNGALLWSGAVWMAGFVLYLLHSWPMLTRARPDNAAGCTGPVLEQAELAQRPRAACGTAG